MKETASNMNVNGEKTKDVNDQNIMDVNYKSIIIFTVENRPIELWEYLILLGAQKIYRYGETVYRYEFLLFTISKDWYAISFTDLNGEAVLNGKEFTESCFSRYYQNYTICSLEALVYVFAVKFHFTEKEKWYKETLKSVKLAHLKKTQDFLMSREKVSRFDLLNKLYNYVNPFLDSKFDAESFIENCVFATTGNYERKWEDGIATDDNIIFKWRKKLSDDTEVEYNFFMFRDYIEYSVTIIEDEKERTLQNHISRKSGEEKIRIFLYNANADCYDVRIAIPLDGPMKFTRNLDQETGPVSEEELKKVEEFIKSSFFTKIG
jgi:hypothetical protein